MTRPPERVVAIDVGGTTLKGAIIERDGRVGAVTRRPTLAGAGAPAVIDAVLDLLTELGRGAPQPLALGLAVPGLVDERSGVVLNAVNLGWRDVPIAELARARLGTPVAVVQDVRAAALAEGLLGAARGKRDYLLLTLGTGVGAAVVIAGRPYTGAHGLGGELGHIAVVPDGPTCGCGRQGCLETLASAGHISGRYHAMSGHDTEPISAEEVARRAAAGEAIAVAVWGEAIQALALALANYATLLDPAMIVIGGGMAAAGDDLFGPLRELLRAQTRFGEPPPVVPAALGDEAGRQGAAIAAWRAAGISADELAKWEARAIGNDSGHEWTVRHERH